MTRGRDTPIRAGARAGEGLLRLDAPRLTPTGVWLDISGQAGRARALETSTNLTDWTPLMTNRSPWTAVVPGHFTAPQWLRAVVTE
jgi:hypothetical protein